MEVPQHWLRPTADLQGLAQVRRHKAAHRVVLGLALALVAVLAVAVPTASAFAAWNGISGLPTAGTPVASLRGEVVARRVMNTDRERLARFRQENREARRNQGAPVSPPLNYENMPSVKEIYNRMYSGNATADAIGGRKRYTYHLLFKELSQQDQAKQLQEYVDFFRYKMSCLNIEITARSPAEIGQYVAEPEAAAAAKLEPPYELASKAQVNLEYEMKRYGIMAKNDKKIDSHWKATWISINLMAPVSATKYIREKILMDRTILRWMLVGHTKRFTDLGEDNELHL